MRLRVPACCGRNLSLFHAAHKNFPSAGCAAAANLVCGVTVIFSKDMKLLKQVLRH
jgi:hypothetical protein